MTEPEETVARPAHAAETAAPHGFHSELVHLLDHYMEDLQAGRAPDRERLLAEHPELAGPLEACLAGIDFIHRAAGPSSRDEPAQLGEFRILREIGRGGMGVVYEAEQTSLKRRVALKVLRFGVVADQDAMHRFRREAETVARLHHTNIVPIFAVGSERGVHYYAMQFIDGRSLADVLAGSAAEARPVPPSHVAAWGLQAAEALAHAHQRGVIHRDIKPSNLLIDAEGTVWLTDFGLAKRVDEVTLTLSGTLMGTPRYMNPEQAESLNRPIDHRTDLYSLGASLYELATGRPVFDSPTPHGVIAQILNHEPTPPRQVRPGLPKDLETIILTCLSKDPSRRYPTAQALADDLRAFLDGRAIKARRARLPERAVRFVRKQKRAIAVAGAGAVVTLLLVAGAVLGWRSFENWRIGWITLRTDGPPLTAQILRDDRDVPVGDEFTVPTRTPPALPEGSYRLRLAGEGLLSETYQFRVSRGEHQAFQVGLSRRRIGQPIDVKEDRGPVNRIGLIEHGDRTDLIEFSQFRIRRTEGSTGTPMWEFPLDAPERAPPDSDRSEWTYLTAFKPSLARPAPDLDGDGVGDVVLGSRMSPTLLALGGKDGKPLWQHRAHHENETTSLPPYNSRGKVAGDPIVVDVDGDGPPDLVAIFFAHAEKPVPAPDLPPDAPPMMADALSWVEAVSGEDGKTLWRREVDCFPMERLANGRYSFEVWEPKLLTLGGRRAIAVTAGTRWVSLDPKTGEPLGPPLSLSVQPLRTGQEEFFSSLRPPRYADLDGDGQPEAIVQGKSADGRAQTLAVTSLAKRSFLWSAEVRSGFTADDDKLSVSEVSQVSDWPLIADLDDDGKAEIVVPDEAPVPGRASEKRKGFRVLEGTTGRLRWSQSVTTSSDGSRVERFLDGPDLDGDGVRELFVAWFLPRSAGAPRIHVDAFSGASGRRLWGWGREVAPFNDLIGPLRWWQGGPDGWPLLVVTHGSAVGSRTNQTDLLQASTGRKLQGADDPAVADLGDFNGDRLPDLLCLQGGASGRRLVVLRGEAPTVWRRLGRWTPIVDLDGDGMADLLNSGPSSGLMLISGRDGRLVWRTGLDGSFSPQATNHVVASFPAPLCDWDGDGAPDLVVMSSQTAWPTRSRDRLPLPLAAISGRTGRRIWSAEPIPTTSPDGKALFCRGVDAHDVDGDGRGEVLLLLDILTTTIRGGSIAQALERRLVRVSGRDGRLGWSTTVLQWSGTGQAHQALFQNAVSFPHEFADLDGDGSDEIVLQVPVITPQGEHRQETLALALGDGRILWRHRNPRPLDGAQANDPTPLFGVGDLDGDHRADVVQIDLVPDRGLEVLCLDGPTGSTRWTWRGGKDDGAFRTSSSPPRLVDLDGTGRRRVFLAVAHDRAGWRLVLLNEGGQVVAQRPTRGEPLSPTRCDLDGDGRDELLFADDGKVWAMRGEFRDLLWSTAEIPWIRETFPATRTHPARVVGTNGRCLDGLDGRPLWLAGPGSVQGFLATEDPRGTPRLVCDEADTVTCRQPLALTAAGTLAPVVGTPRAYREAIDDPGRLRPLPWTEGAAGNEADRALFRWLPLWALLAGLFSDVTLVLPGWHLGRMIRRRTWNVRALLVAPVLVAVDFAAYWVVAAYAPTPPGPGIVCLLLTVGGCPVLLLAGAAWRALWKRRWWGLLGLGALSLAGSLVLALLFLHADAKTIGPDEHYSRDGWATILVVGAWAAGIPLLAGWVVRALWQTGRGVRGRFRPGKPAGVVA